MEATEEECWSCLNQTSCPQFLLQLLSVMSKAPNIMKLLRCVSECKDPGPAA